MKTKFEETLKSTGNIKDMAGNYLAERLVRKWSEDFVDEDTGETVSIERNEIILDKGTWIGSKEITEINFYLQSGDITEVLVSDQKRPGKCVGTFTSVWSVTVSVGSKKKTYFLYANSVQTAIEILTDYLEQILEGAFAFTQLKELDYSNLISIEDDEDLDFYKIVIGVEYDGDAPITQSYIVQANDAEDAKERIVKYLLLEKERVNDDTPFETTIISAKTIPLNSIVDYRFSKEYLERICQQ